MTGTVYPSTNIEAKFPCFDLSKGSVFLQLEQSNALRDYQSNLSAIFAQRVNSRTASAESSERQRISIDPRVRSDSNNGGDQTLTRV